MKKLLVFGLLSVLAACQPQMVQKPLQGEEPMKGGAPQMSAIGFHDSVDWNCHQADYNENLVWIECTFQNTSWTLAQRECISVIISDVDGKEVDHSRVVCTNLMKPGEAYENNVAVQNSKHSHQRALVAERCGLDTSRCKLTTKIESVK